MLTIPLSQAVLSPLALSSRRARDRRHCCCCSIEDRDAAIVTEKTVKLNPFYGLFELETRNFDLYLIRLNFVEILPVTNQGNQD